MKIKVVVAAIVMAIVSGYAHGTALQKRVHVQQEFDIKAGRVALVKEAGLRLSFIELIEDSRCPEGVDCIWAGNGKINLTVKKGKQESVSFELNTTTEPKSFTYQGYEITLVRLAPYPKKDVVLTKGEYVATLIVKKCSSS